MRCLPVVLCCLVLASCAMWTPMDPGWTEAERDAHAAQVAKDEANLRAGAEFAEIVLPGGFGKVGGLITLAVMGIAAMVRNRKR